MTFEIPSTCIYCYEVPFSIRLVFASSTCSTYTPKQTMRRSRRCVRRRLLRVDFTTILRGLLVEMRILLLLRAEACGGSQ